MRHHLVTAFLVIASMILSTVPVRPYTLQFTDASSSVQIKWPTNTITVALSTSLSSPPGNIKAGSDVLGAVRRAFAHWAEAANIRFVEVSSNAQSISSSGGSGDGISLITVAHTPENDAAFNGLSSEMSGRTRVFFTRRGGITEADIVLNPDQQFSSDGTPGTYDLEAIFTHEIGHLLGLEHSGSVGSTMQPRQGKNGIYSLSAWTPRTLSDDDRAGVRAIYGMRPGASPRGAIMGTISFNTGAPAFGANVWAEEITTGRVSASNITTANGAYRIEGLLPGNYRVLVEPLNGSVVASEIASRRGAYASLMTGQPAAFRTAEIGQVSLASGSAITVNAQLPLDPPLLNPSLVGLNGELSTIAVPISAGHTYTVYIGGEGVNTNQIPVTGITVASPFIAVNPASVVQQQFSPGVSVISFDMTVSPGAPLGDYSLRLQSNTGEIAYIAGCLTLDGSERVAGPAQSQTFMAQATAPADAQDALAAGSLASLSGERLADASVKATDVDAQTPGVQLPEQLGGTEVYLTDSSGVTAQAPLTFVSERRVGFQIPDETALGTALVEVRHNQETAAHMAVEIVQTQPAVFTQNGIGSGPALAFNAETMLPATLDLPAQGAAASDVQSRVVIFGTGLRHASSLSALLGGQEVMIESIGPAPDFPGLDQLVIVLPRDALLTGKRKLVLTAEGGQNDIGKLIVIL